MNTVTDQTTLCARVVSDRAEIDRLRWFQTHRYFESGLIDELPSELDRDKLVDSSIYFGVYHDDEICGTVRIVRPEAELPMLEHHSLYPEVQKYLTNHRNSVAEVSRLAVGRKTQPRQALAMLMREFLHFGFRYQEATLIIASVERPLVRVLNRLLGVPLRIIGPSVTHYADFEGETVPILIDTVECLETFRQKNSRYWAFFLEGLVIDLTEDQPADRQEMETLAG